jgi:4-hydroxybutyrate dehydrogenase / sulfolactaldehyde 3-reductase
MTRSLRASGRRPNPVTRSWATQSSSVRGDIEPGFTIDLAHKDLSIIIAAANAEHVPVPVAAAAREMFSLARASGHGAADFSAIVDSLCDAAGIEKPRVPDDWKHQA